MNYYFDYFDCFDCFPCYGDSWSFAADWWVRSWCFPVLAVVYSCHAPSGRFRPIARSLPRSCPRFHPLSLPSLPSPCSSYDPLVARCALFSRPVFLVPSRDRCILACWECLHCCLRIIKMFSNINIIKI